jgi:PAS domain S-box-containing protein
MPRRTRKFAATKKIRKRLGEELKEIEEQFRKIMDYIPGVSIQGYRVDGTVFYWNKASEQVYGYTAEEAIGKNLADLIVPRNLKTLFRKCLDLGKQIKETGEFMPSGELLLLNKKGHLVPVYSVHTAIYRDNDEPLLFCIDVDLSDRKLMEEILQIKEWAIESSISAIALSDLKGTLTYVNDSFLKLWGYTDKGEVMGKHVVEFWKSKEEAAQIIGVLRDDSNWIGELVAKRKDGSIFDVQLTASMVKNEQGAPVYMMASFIDITKRKQAEIVLKERERELEMKTGHLEEVNTALKVLLKKREEDRTELEGKVMLNIKELVQPYVEKLKSSELDERQKAYVDILESNLSEVISSFSSRLSSQYINLTPKEIQVVNLVKQGKTNKEIADLLNISARTVAFHRENIRKKLRLHNTRTNLKSFLLLKR